MIHFKNRSDAAKQLALKLHKFKNNKDAIVLGLPRGGVPMAASIAHYLQIPFDIVISRKIGAPDAPELALGSITQEGVVLWNEEELVYIGVAKDQLQQTIKEETAELHRRLTLYRGTKSPLNLRDTIAILVDDGIATGATMRAAITSAKLMGAQKIIVAVPVVPANRVDEFRKLTHSFIYLDAPQFFLGINLFYNDFPQVTDAQVIALMQGEK